MSRRFEEAVERILEDGAGGAMSAGPGGAMGTPDTPGQYGGNNDARLPWGSKRIARRGSLTKKKKRKA
jgi:hypothetical protein